MSRFSRETESTGEREKESEIYYEEMVHVIKAAEKFYNLLLASWRPREDSSVTKYEPKGLGVRGADGINPSVRKGIDKIRCPTLNCEARIYWMVIQGIYLI